MRIAVVCPYDLGASGGVQDQARSLCRWLSESGHEAWLVGPGSSGTSGEVSVGPVSVVAANGSAAPLALRPSAWRHTRAALAGADVVHVHEPFMPTVSLAALSAPLLPKVGTFHAAPPSAVRRLYEVGSPVLRRLAGRITVATAVSPVAAQAVRKLVRTREIPNGIDASLFSVGEKAQGRVVFLGRDDPRKGLDVLLGAWPEVMRRVPSAELVVAGVQRDALHGVRFLGRVAEEDKRALLGSAEIFCAPNTGGESFGLVLVEAMASGCALVASALQGFVHVAGPAAVFVKPGEARGLAAVLADLLQDAGRRRSLAAAAGARVGRFDRKVVLEAYLEAYEAALAAGPAGRNAADA